MRGGRGVIKDFGDAADRARTDAIREGVPEKEAVLGDLEGR